MKLNLLGTTVVLLVAFLPRHECRAVESPGAAHRALRAASGSRSGSDLQHQLRQPGPVLERLGEEYFIRLANGNTNPFGSPAIYNRALQLQTSGAIRGHIGDLQSRRPVEESMEEERGRRSEDPPISLDLTFHLLREMMEMSRAEQLVQQAQNNRRMMELFGK